VTDAPRDPEEGTAETAVETAVEALGIDIPDEPDEAVELLAARALEARREAESHLDDLRRLAAEFENFRKRSDRDRGDMIASASRRVASALLPVLDSLDAAAAGTRVETPGEERLRAGLLRTREQLLDVLGAEGVAPIEVAPGAAFDPAVHEAVTGGGDGHLVVTAVLRRGYTINDRLLRPAMVEVAAEDLLEDAPVDDAEG
jgi:molecular chaperone GrpE